MNVPEPDAPRPSPEPIDAVMLAAQVLVEITAQSVAGVADQVTPQQFRVLVMIASQGPRNLASVAEGLGVHPSNATRTCDKLVQAGLIHRSDDPADRRHLILRLTPTGRQLLQTVCEHRRSAIANILAKMPAQLRNDLVPALLAFAHAASELPPAEQEAGLEGSPAERTYR